MPTPWLSAIVVAYNNRALTARCLAALAEGWPADWELVLADNGSTDDTAAVADDVRHRFPALVVARMAVNVTFSEVANAAARQASGRHLVFLNNDIEVSPDALRVMVGALARYPRAGIAGTKLVYPGGRRVQHGGVRPMLWGLVSNYGTGASPDDPRVNVAGPIFAVTGACVVIERALFDTLGGFDTGYRWGYEDIDLCLRAREAGREVVYEPSVMAIHAESQTLGAAHYDRARDLNHQHFRARWNRWLAPMEARYLAGLHERGYSRVAIFGAGAAGRALAQVLADDGFEVMAFVETQPRGSTVDGRPVVSLAGAARDGIDALVAGTQFYFEIEPSLRAALPDTPIVFPVLD